MADVIKEQDVERLVSRAKQYADTDKYSPVELMKLVMESEKCSLAEAKEAYTLVSRNETLGEYQERVILPLIEGLEEEESSPAKQGES